MAVDRSLHEIVLFELPSWRLADRLLAHVGEERLSWLEDEAAPVVAVLLNSNQLDLALLLRGVQAWLRRTTLAAIRFEVDGRVYVIEAQEPALVAG